MSDFFVHLFLHAKLVAIESGAENFAMLRRNVGPHPNVVPIQGATARDGPQEIHVVIISPTVIKSSTDRSSKMWAVSTLRGSVEPTFRRSHRTVKRMGFGMLG